MSVILGIETSGLEGWIAIRRDGELLAEVALDRTRRRHAQTLVLEVQQLLQSHQLTARDVDVVAVSIGPGSFTGLRVGVVFANTFAYSTGAKLVAVDTMQAIACVAPDEFASVGVVADALREEVYFAVYDRIDDLYWRRQADVCILPLSQWQERLRQSVNPRFAITGPGLVKFQADVPGDVSILDSSHWDPRAASIALLGEQLAEQGVFADPARLEPFYLRKSAAEEKRDQQQTI